eukprot:jgi/Botrbrau1/22703/Bobra.0132s0042.1
MMCAQPLLAPLLLLLLLCSDHFLGGTIPWALRWFLIGTQYRQPINYTLRGLEEASDRLFYIYQTLQDAADVLDGSNEGGAAARMSASTDLQAGLGPGSQVLQAVRDALLDDLNTPVAISELSAPLKSLNDLLHTKAGRKAKDRLPLVASLSSAIQQTLELLGLWRDTPPSQVLGELKSLALTRAGLTEDDVAAAIQRRAEARQNKDYGAADAVRSDMETRGIQIMDTSAGTSWRPSSPKPQDI